LATGADAGTVTVIVTTLAPGSGFGENVAVAPAGSPLTEGVMLALKPAPFKPEAVTV
jgi:hypothetical protein